MRVVVIFAKCAKLHRRKKIEEILKKFADSYLGNHYRDFIQI